VKKLIFEYWTPVMVWLLAMLFFSTDMMSSSETSRFIVPILTFVFPGLSPTEIKVWHGVIRKFGHISEYFILAMLVYRSVKYEHPDLVDAKLRTIAFVGMVAVLDELHQGFTAFRTASILDVGYDWLGGVWALWLVTTYEGRHLRPRSVL
jgi:VanZ family protein